MAKQFDVVISPSVKKGEDSQEVAARLAKTLRVDQQKVLKWLTGSVPVTIVRGTSKDVAQKYVNAIQSAGAKAVILPQKVVKGKAPRKPSATADVRTGGSFFSIQSFLVMTVTACLSLGGGWTLVQLWEEQERQRIMGTPPTKEARESAEITAAVLNLYQAGKGEEVLELADILSRMRGKDTAALDSQKSIVIDMMKGLGVDPFISLISDTEIVNRQTNTANQRQQGITSFTLSELELIHPSSDEHGFDKLLARVAQRKGIKNLANPGEVLLISDLESLDDEELKRLLPSLPIDLEWSSFMNKLVALFLREEKVEEADQLAREIKNPRIRAQALAQIIVYLQNRRQPEDLLNSYVKRINGTLANLPDPSVRVDILMELARQLASVGDQSEPGETYNLLRKSITAEKNVYIKPMLWGRLAKLTFNSGDVRGALSSLGRALDSVSAIEEKVERLAAYCKLSRSYFDTRKVSIASQILSEAAFIAQTELDGSQRARIFGEIAMSKGYMGDLDGAIEAARIAASPAGEQQLLGKLAQMNVEHQRVHQAAAILDLMEDDAESSRVLFRLVAKLIHNDDRESALYYLNKGESRVRGVKIPEVRAMLTAQLARLFHRLGEEKRGNQLFAGSLMITHQLAGMKADLSLATLALDQARGLKIDGAKNSRDRIDNVVVKDSVSKELDRTQKILLNNFPRTY